MSSDASIHILIMEDDTEQAHLMQRGLEQAGYCVVLASNGDEGLTCYGAGSYDLLIVDCQMPGTGGLDVLRTLIAEGTLPPTLLITDPGDESSAVEALHLGADDYVSKDAEGRYLTLLSTVIERIFHQRRLVETKQQAEQALKETLEKLEARVQERTSDLQRVNTQLQAEVTERKRAEHAVAEREARLRAILDTTVDGIITIDKRGIVESFNLAAERIFGYAAADVVGHNISMLMPSPYREEHDGYLAHYLRTGEKKIIGIGREVVAQRQDGILFPIKIAISEVGFKDQRLFTGIVHDLSEHQRVEQELQRADRLALVGQLASGLAHEIGTPLNVIEGNAELLHMELRQRGVPTAEVETIVDQADRITRLIQQLLTFARAKDQAIEPMSLHTPLSHALRLLETRFRREAIAVVVNMPADLPLVQGAADQIEQVFLNVLVNAWHAMPDGGTVTVRAGATDDQRVHITLRDTGVGMSATDLERAFELFYSTKGDQGTGLGLAICKQIIDSHRGTMQLESTPGNGTTVTIKLPQTTVSPHITQTERRA
ncbi:Adaptive-response sensory-kinase SasA [Candidatus Entotheonellaceae bacterium PAL068K]